MFFKSDSRTAKFDARTSSSVKKNGRSRNLKRFNLELTRFYQDDWRDKWQFKIIATDIRVRELIQRETFLLEGCE